MTEAAYSGVLSATYGYSFDALGNRTRYTTTITATEVVAYQYDAANRLLESAVSGGDVTTYDWDAMGRLITTTVAGNVSRVYQYSQNGNLVSADVDGLLTTFSYDGNGNRLRMPVAGEVTTYTLDYGNGLQILMEQGGAFAGTKHYLYGVQCIGEQVDAGKPEKAEWRYYYRDGNPLTGSGLVRQTTNSAAKITLAWACSPEGAVLIGEKGSVTNLGCGDIYDWSTGLIYEGGRYFDH
jgi:YD repeat-containing protein